MVDDEPAILDLVASVLDGYSVTTTTDPSQALATLLSSGHGIKLVISDYNMPQMNGLDLYRRLKTSSGHSPLPFHFFILTGTPTKILEDEAMKLGVNAILHKPFDQDILQTKVESIFGVNGYSN